MRRFYLFSFISALSLLIYTSTGWSRHYKSDSKTSIEDQAVSTAPSGDDTAPSSDKPSKHSSFLPEVYMGNPHAEHVVIMYFSPTCHHCAEYERDFLPEVEKEFIKTDKIKFVFRLLPFQSLDFAIAKIAWSRGPENFIHILKLFLNHQDDWLIPSFAEGEERQKFLKHHIMHLSQKLGLKEEEILIPLNIDEKDDLAFIKLFCLEHGFNISEIVTILAENEEIEKSIAATHLQAEKLKEGGLDYVPAFVIDGKLQENWAKPELLREKIK